MLVRWSVPCEGVRRRLVSILKERAVLLVAGSEFSPRKAEEQLGLSLNMSAEPGAIAAFGR